MVLNRRIVRTILKDKARYIGAIFLVAVGVMLFAAASDLDLNLSRSLDNFVRDSRLEDVMTVTSRPVLGVGELEERFGASLEVRRQIDATLEEGVTLRVFDASGKVNIPAVVAGTNLGGNGDILLNQAFAQAQGVAVGDTIAFFGQQFRVTGFVSLPDYIYPTRLDNDIVYDPKIFGVGVVSKEAMDALPFSGQTLHIRCDANQQAGLKAELDKRYGVVVWRETKDNSRYQMIESEISGLRMMTYTIPTAVFALTCLLLASIMRRMTRLDFIQIGTLYALGYRKGEIMRHYLVYPAVISLIGSLLGMALTIVALPATLRFYLLYFNLPIYGIWHHVSTYVEALLAPAVMLLFSTWWVVWRALRLSPLRLMRGHRENARISLLERRIKLQGFSFGVKFRLRELLRNRSRLAVMALAVAVASAFLMMGFVVQNSFGYIAGEGFADTFKYRYNYVLNGISTEPVAGGEAYSLAAFQTEDGDNDFVVYGLTPNSSMVSLSGSDGDRIPSGDVVVTRPLANRLGLKPPQVIKAVEKLTGKECAIAVDTVAEVYTGFSVYMPRAELNAMMNYPDEAYTGLFSQKTLELNASVLLRVEDREDIAAAFAGFIEPFRRIFYGVGVLAFLIALVAIYIIISLAVEENRVSIATLKVLGYTPREINGLVLSSGTIPMVLGFLFSLPLLVRGMSWALVSSMAEVDMAIPIILRPIDVALGFLLTLGAYLVSRFAAGRKVFAIPMSESLKAQRE